MSIEDMASDSIDGGEGIDGEQGIDGGVEKGVFSIHMTARAARHICSILSTDEREDGFLRISVLGGGCSGFQYDFKIDAGEVLGDDLVLERDGARIVIDRLSCLYMEGSEIDFVESLLSASFQINNPNATASCGCGTSFSI